MLTTRDQTETAAAKAMFDQELTHASRESVIPRQTSRDGKLYPVLYSRGKSRASRTAARGSRPCAQLEKTLNADRESKCTERSLWLELA